MMSVTGSANHSKGSNERLSRLGIELSELPSMISERIRGRSEDSEKRLKLGRYLVLGELGHGGMGVVYEAWDPHIERFVAIKTLEPDLVSEPEIREETIQRFLRETKIVGRLRHPAIITIFDYGHEPDNMSRAEIYRPGCIYFYVMELLEGESLASLMRRKKQLADATAVRITRDVAEALAVAHKGGIIHRDIKPSNIFVREGGQAVLIDFGIAQSESTRLTNHGHILGTPSYLAPERLQEKQREVDGRADQFSLGVLLYTMLTGERPFLGSTVKEILSNVTKQAHRRLERETSAGKHLSKLLDRMLAKDPANRFESAEPIAKALDEIAGSLERKEPAKAGVAAAPPAAPLQAAMENAATEVATATHPSQQVRFGHLEPTDGTRPDAALQRQTRQIRNQQTLQDLSVGKSVTPGNSSLVVPSQRYGSMSEEETLAAGDAVAQVEQVVVTESLTKPKASIRAQTVRESEAFLGQNESIEESTDDFGTLERTEQVRATGFVSDATEIVRTRKNNQAGQGQKAEWSSAPSSEEPNSALPSAAVARRTFGVQERKQEKRRAGAKGGGRKKPRPNIKIDAKNLGVRPAPNRKLQNRIAIMAGAILCAIAIGLLIGRKRLSNQMAETPIATTPAPQLVRPVAKGSNGPAGSNSKAAIPRLVAPRTAKSWLEAAEKSLAVADFERSKQQFVRARLSKGVSPEVLERATLGELRAAVALNERKLAKSLLRDMETREFSPKIIQRGRQALEQGGDKKPRREVKKVQRVQKTLSCKDVALKHLNYPQEGVKALLKLSAKEPKNACAHKQLGLFYGRLNQPKKAMQSYEKYLELARKPADEAAVRKKIGALKRLLGD
ncbi:MAG: serine/threonine-protein kinase [Myxococcota bacterium]|nr:serine/threonine-protein kinase [Myxococcota bacterium]